MDPPPSCPLAFAMKPRVRSLTSSLCCAIALSWAGRAGAHHGDEFLVVDDYTLGPPGTMHFSTGFDWETFNGLNAFGSESMYFLSIAPQIGLSVSATFLDEGDGWGYSSVTPRLHVQLTPPEWDIPVRAGISIGCQIVDGAAGYGTHRVRSVFYEQVDCGCQTINVPSAPAASPVQSTGGSSSGGGPVCDPNVDVDCVPPPAQRSAARDDAGGSPGARHAEAKHAGHADAQVPPVAPSAGGGGAGASTRRKTKTVRRVTYQHVPEDRGHDTGGIHNHHSNLWIGRLIVEADLGPGKAIFNLIGISPEGAAPSWGYAAGLRRQLSHDFGLGVEAMGDFDPRGMHELIVAGYYSPVHSVGLKLGAGFGLTQASADFSLRSGIIWRF